MTPQEEFERDKKGNVQDATVNDFLLPMLMARLPLAGTAAGPAATAAEDAYGTPMREALMRTMAEPAKGYAFGGEVMPDLGNIPIPGSSFDVDNQSTTMKTAGNIPPPPIPPALVAALASRTAPAAPPPGAAAGAPAAAPVRPQPAMPGMGDVLSQAQAAGGQLFGPYSPEKRNELYAMLAQNATGMSSAIGSSLASVGDAIARGYGRDQTNFLDKTLQGQQEGRKEALDAFDTAQKGTLQATSAGMDLQKMDPNSAVSKISREAYAPLLAKLGYSPQALAKMTGANVESVAKVAADLGGKEMENLFHQAQLIVETQMQRAQLGMKQEEHKNEALKELHSHPISSLLPTATNDALKHQAGLAGPTTGQAAVPPTRTIGGKTYVNHNGQWYEQ